MFECKGMVYMGAKVVFRYCLGLFMFDVSLQHYFFSVQYVVFDVWLQS